MWLKHERLTGTYTEERERKRERGKKIGRNRFNLDGPLIGFFPGVITGLDVVIINRFNATGFVIFFKDRNRYTTGT